MARGWPGTKPGLGWWLGAAGAGEGAELPGRDGGWTPPLTELPGLEGGWTPPLTEDGRPGVGRKAIGRTRALPWNSIITIMK